MNRRSKGVFCWTLVCQRRSGLWDSSWGYVADPIHVTCQQFLTFGLQFWLTKNFFLFRESKRSIGLKLLAAAMTATRRLTTTSTYFSATPSRYAAIKSLGIRYDDWLEFLWFELITFFHIDHNSFRVLFMAIRVHVAAQSSAKFQRRIRQHHIHVQSPDWHPLGHRQNYQSTVWCQSRRD